MKTSALQHRESPQRRAGMNDVGMTLRFCALRVAPSSPSALGDGIGGREQRSDRVFVDDGGA